MSTHYDNLCHLRPPVDPRRNTGEEVDAVPWSISSFRARKGTGSGILTGSSTSNGDIP